MASKQKGLAAGARKNAFLTVETGHRGEDSSTATTLCVSCVVIFYHTDDRKNLWKKRKQETER